ncbi:MAG: hypothetical protein ACRDMZ_00280 [Solirubrobacteraceae bacterium]
MDPRRFGGVCLVGAAVTFWLTWFLMPMPGTTDVVFILAQVGATPERVWWSVAAQLVSSALFVPGLLAFAAAPELRGSPLAFVSASLAGIGATGFAADAIYHLLAYEMTRPEIARDAMVPVMTRFQSQDLVFVAPQLLLLLLGFLLLSVCAARARLVPRTNPGLYLAALVLALGGGLLAGAIPQGRRAVALGVLALISLSVSWVGVALARGASEPHALRS